jgi:hypothetical protein
MGWKTAILVACDDDPAGCLRAPGPLDPGATADLVAKAYPGWTTTRTRGVPLREASYPPPGVGYAGGFGSVDILCDRALMLDHPSRLPPHLVALGSGRRLTVHAMHSVVDFFAYGVWEDGALVRSLSMALGGPRPGIMENIGAPLPFEEPFWAGRHAIGDGYPLPFYPLDLAEPTALRALFGFTLSAPPAPGEAGPDRIGLAGFSVPGPTGPPEFTRTHKRARYRLVDGRLVTTDE